MMKRMMCLASLCTAIALGGIAIVGSAGAASAAPANPTVSKLKLVNGWVSHNCRTVPSTRHSGML
jgi:hypothetical protein